MITIVVTLPARHRPGPVDPDLSDLPPGITVAGSQIRDDQQAFDVTVSGPAETLAVFGLMAAIDPISQAVRAALRQSLGRCNRLAEAIGRPDLIEPEPEAIARLIQSLRSGGGLPEPPEPTED